MLTYGDFNISDLGDITISQQREFEGGDSPQRVKVTLAVKVEVFQDNFGDNYNLVSQLRTALLKQHEMLVWTNDDTNENYVSCPAVPVSNDLPEDPNGWGSYHQACHLVFSFYEHNLATGNLPLVIKRTGDTGNLTLTNVKEWHESVTTERWSPLHAERKMVTGKISASGMILADPTLSLANQRTFLADQKTALDELDGLECLMTFGDFFNQTVRVDEFTVEINQAVNAIGYSFTAHYTRFPDEKSYSMVEFQVDQRDNNTGEQFLDLTGKIVATDEATARARLALLTTAVLQQYQFNTAQPLKQDSSASQISPAGEDPDIFTELSFTLSYRRWRTDNQDAQFQKTGAAAATNLPNVRVWIVEYTARRFNELRSQRQFAGGRVEAAGTVPGDMTLTLAARRTALLAVVTALTTAVNGADGSLTRGTLFNQVVRMENFKAEINQAITAVEWSLTASYSNFPNEGAYATVEFSVAQRDAVDDGEQYLVFSGRIWAPDETLARAKLATVRTSVLSTYGFTAPQQIREESAAASVSGNGDKTAGYAAHELTDGTTFTELTWTEEYRHRKAGLVNWSLKTSVHDDVGSGLRQTTYAGFVQATGSTPDAAYTAAAAQAAALGANKETAIGGGAYLRMSSLTQDTRQTRADNVTEFVRLEFSYEYQSKLAAGRALMEVSMELATDAFGPDMESVNGFVVATDFPTAESFYASVRSLYTGRLVRGERTNESQVQAQNASGGFTVQQMRLDFSFQVFRPKAAGKVSYKYGISTSKDILSLQLNVRLHGSIYADSLASAQTALGTLSLASYGSLLRDEQDQDREYTSDSSDNFIKLDFDQQFTNKLTGISELLEMTLTEEVNYSGERWVVQPTLKDATGAGGFSVPQSVSILEGRRTVRGTVSASAYLPCETWGKKQRALLTGDKNSNHYVQPEQWTKNYDLMPRIEGIVVGANPNVRIYKVEFVFSEILPNYPAPA